MIITRENIEKASYYFFITFVFLMVAFNRNFAYLSIVVHGIPAYITEVFIVLMLASFTLSPMLRGLLWAPRTKILTILITGLLLLTVFKFFFHSAPNFVLRLRQSAIAYYLIFILFAIVFNQTQEQRQRFFHMALIGSLISTGICIFSYISNSIVKLFPNFHGLPAFMVMGLVCLYLINAEFVDFVRSPKLAWVFLLEYSALMLLGGRSVVSGFLLSAGLVLLIFIFNKKGRKTFWVSLLISSLIAGLLIAGRMKGIIKLKSQDIWQQSWSSWSQFDKIISTEKPTLATVPVPSAELPVPKRKIHKRKSVLANVMPPAPSVVRPAVPLVNESVSVVEKILPVQEVPSLPASPPATVAAPPAPAEAVPAVPVAAPPAPAEAVPAAPVAAPPAPVTEPRAPIMNAVSSVPEDKVPAPRKLLRHNAQMLLASTTSNSSVVQIPEDAADRLPRLTRKKEPFVLGPGLLLVSDILTPEFLKRGYSSSVNNAIWRVELWRLTMASVLEHSPLIGFPLGTSINMAVFAPEDFMENVDLHNSHLAFLFRFGFLGFGLYLAIIVIAARRFILLAKTNSIGWFYLSGLIFAEILACFNVMWEGPFCASLFWIFVGTGLAQAASEE